MGLLNPDYLFKKTTNITPDFLAKLGIKNLILDVDNTLATHGNPQPAPGVEEWIKLMRDSGIKLVIASNNYAKRVAPFADRLGLDYVSFSVKPSPLGFSKALKKLGGSTKDTAVVGDQILTDVLGAHLMGMKALMVLAILEEGTLGFKIKRRFEKGYIEKYIREHGGAL